MPFFGPICSHPIFSDTTTIPQPGPHFVYVGSGGFVLLGCAHPVHHTIFVDNLFNIGDFAWITAAAHKGHLARICIKKINIVDLLNFNYQDTNNRLWLQYELCTLETAQALVAEYLVREEEFENLKQKCLIRPSARPDSHY